MKTGGDDVSAEKAAEAEAEAEAGGAGVDYGAQIPAAMLASLAPNGEADFLLGKINGMGEAEALAVVRAALDFHADDWNFPSETRRRMQRLLGGEAAYGAHYGRDLRVDAVVMRWSSPYPGVRAVACPLDEPDVPVETIRAYVLGIGWAMVGTFVSTFFNSRFPSISLNGSVIQILLYPCAKALERTLPDWGVTVLGTRHSLNPGPWTFKEQMFATITYNIAIYTTNSYGMILVQRSPVYYGLGFVTFGYQLTLTLFVQLMGMGFAGFLRRFSVYPVKAVWPTVLPIIAMNRALTRPEGDGDGSGPGAVEGGWTVSRQRFFCYAAGGMFVYYWLPGYLFTALSQLNWMTWIAPGSVRLAILTGSGLGLGLLNPLTTLDWNVATSSYAALAQPFFSTCTMYCGSVLGGLVILAIYYGNMYDTAYLPINSSTAFANDGRPPTRRRCTRPATC
ncbi:hypothetical protein CDD83_4595 [Cordyceps sp. RAO-2017]|nr:hypothetical protein CDD83_4595 [Cordyceps sp. RAO-2017]